MFVLNCSSSYRKIRHRVSEKQWYIYSKEYYSAKKGSKELEDVVNSMDLEGIMLNKICPFHNVTHRVSQFFLLLLFSYKDVSDSLQPHCGL